MKIAIWHNLPSGGAKRALYYHTRGLLQRGHMLEAWCPSTANQDYLPLQEMIKVNIRDMPWKSLSPKSSSFQKLRWGVHEFFQNIKALDEHTRQCAAEINKGGFDVLYAHSSAFLSVAPIARYVTGPKVLFLHEPNRQVFEALPEIPWLTPAFSLRTLQPASFVEYVKGRILARYRMTLAREEWHNIRSFNLILCNSYFSRENILRAYGVDARVCYLGIDTNLFEKRSVQKDNVVIGVGSFNPTKNVEFIISALAAVKEPRPRLFWIGNYSVAGYVELLNKFAADSRVDLTTREMVSDDTMIDLLNRALMMVYAPRLEPFGRTPLEANACGLPVVAVAEGGIRETVIDGVNGYLVDSDPSAMARAIERLRDNPELARTLGNKGMKFVAEKWSLNAANDRIEQLLENTITSVRRIS